MNEEQMARWNRFKDNFRSWSNDGSNQRTNPLIELKPFFEPFQLNEISLKVACENPQFAAVLAQKGIPPAWAGCFSWTEIDHGYHGDGLFYPYLERVLSRLLVGRKIKGLQIQIQHYDDFMKGQTMLVAKNYVLAWSKEQPHIDKNIDGRLAEDKVDFIRKELQHFLESEIPREKNGCDLVRGYTSVKEAVSKLSAEAGIGLNINALDRQHNEIELTGKESYEELTLKCELARCEIRSYKKETKVLETIENMLKVWLENENCRKEDDIAHFIAESVIENVYKKIIREDEVRRILNILDLPEGDVVTIKGFGFTYYKTAIAIKRNRLF
jgi:hypothetical protein